MRKTVLQLAAERIADVKWKRSAVMELLQFDLFKWYFKRHSPDFATFFANSTAHFQHCYWRHMKPELFESKPDERERRKVQRRDSFRLQVYG